MILACLSSLPNSNIAKLASPIRIEFLEEAWGEALHASYVPRFAFPGSLHIINA